MQLQERGLPSIYTLFSVHFLDPVTKARLLGQACIDAHLKFFREADGDFAKSLYEYRAPGTEIVRTPEDYDRLIARDLSYIDKQLAFCKTLVEQTNPDLFGIGTLYGVWGTSYIPCQSDVGMDRFDQDYADLADGINWGVHDVPMSLEEGRARWGKTVIGGMANHKGVLVDGTEEDVRAEVRDIVKKFGRKGFILGADCTLSSDQDLNLMWAAIHEARSL